MRQPTPHPRNRRAGHALLETAFVLLPLLITFIGIFDVGQVLYLHQTAAERVRAAARYGAIHYQHADAIRNVVLYGSPASPTAAGAPAFLGLSPANVAVTRLGAGTAEHRLQITVSGLRYATFTPFFAGLKTMRSVSASIPVEAVD
jgi:Flp pilus assembly protein TadG